MRFLSYTEDVDNKVPTKGDIDTTGQDVILTIDQQAKLNELLENKLGKQWLNASEYQMSDEIESFAKNCKHAGTEFNIGLLIEYGENLFTYVDSFDLEMMDKSLKAWPKMIKGLFKSIKVAH
jgi:hypothetical protein